MSRKCDKHGCPSSAFFCVSFASKEKIEPGNPFSGSKDVKRAYACPKHVSDIESLMDAERAKLGNSWYLGVRVTNYIDID
jgi:hypothetical protein